MIGDGAKRELVAVLGDRLLPETAAKIAAARSFPMCRSSDAFSDPRAVLPKLLAHDVISFDLFDTVVRRRLPLVAVQQRVSEFADNFLRGDDGPLPRGLLLRARARLMQVMQSEVIATSCGARDEIRLVDVFDAALRPYMRDAVGRGWAVDALIAEEVAAELACLEADPRMIETIQALRAAGRQVILMSDMYLDTGAVVEILQALRVSGLFDHVFVSASVGVTKRGGQLFAHVDQALDLRGRARLHLGDNIEADVRAARASGWAALHFHDPQAERKRMVRARLGDHPRARRRLGRDRLEQGFAMDGPEPLIAAAFAAYAREVVARAVEGRFDRVLFLSRDATRFRHGAEAFLANRAGRNAIPCPPFGDLALSRRSGAWLLYPGKGDPGWQAFLAAQVWFVNRTPLSIRTIMRTFALCSDDLDGLPEETQAEVARYLEGDDPKTDLGFDRLLARHDLLEALDAAIMAKRGRMIAYLEQVGLLDASARFLLVDIGYSGTALKALSEHFWQRERAGLLPGARVELMLLAANRFHSGNLGQMHPNIVMLPGAFIGTEKASHRAMAVNFSWLEPFAADVTRGALRDYRQDAEGQMAPEFGPAPDRADDAALAARMAGLGLAYEKALAASGLSLDEADAMIVSRLERRVTRPRRSDVAALAALAHQGGIGEVRSQGLIHRIRPHRLVGDILACIHRDCWLQGSLKAAGLGGMIPLVNAIVALEAE